MILKHLLQNASSTTMEYVLTPDRAKLKESIDDQINQIDRYAVCFVLCIKILIQPQVVKIDNNSSTNSCEYSRTCPTERVLHVAVGVARSEPLIVLSTRNDLEF